MGGTPELSTSVTDTPYESSPLEQAQEAFRDLLTSLTNQIRGEVHEGETIRQFGYFLKYTLETSLHANVFDAIFGEDRGSDSRNSRPSRDHGASLMKRFLSKKRSRTEMVHDLMTSNESLLCQIPLSNIVNARSFNTMIPAVTKDTLMSLLPECDTDSYESVSAVFNNPEFLNSLHLFQRHLQASTFDTSDINTYGTGRRRKEIEPWKLEHFEHVWGQRLLSEILVEAPAHNTPAFSYTDPEIADLPIFAEPMPIPSSAGSILEVRQALANRDLSCAANLLFVDGPMGHWRRRRAAFYRNPEAELFIRW